MLFPGERRGPGPLATADRPKPARLRARLRSVRDGVVDWLGAQGAGNLLIMMIALMIVLLLLLGPTG